MAVVQLKKASRTVELADYEQSVSLLQSELRIFYRMHAGHRGDGLGELAQRAEVGVTAISRLASGETMWPRHRTVWNLYFALGWRLWASKDG